jgi:hypothetical protein
MRISVADPTVIRHTHTTIPSDGTFRFKALLQSEGLKGGMRVTIPAPIARGIVLFGGGQRWMKLNQGPWFKVEPRAANPKQTVVSIPLGARIALAPGVVVGVKVIVEDQPGPRWLDEE